MWKIVREGHAIADVLGDAFIRWTGDPEKDAALEREFAETARQVRAVQGDWMHTARIQSEQSKRMGGQLTQSAIPPETSQNVSNTQVPKE